MRDMLTMLAILALCLVVFLLKARELETKYKAELDACNKAYSNLVVALEQCETAHMNHYCVLLHDHEVDD